MPYFFLATKESNQEVVDTIVQYCKTNLPRYYHVDPLQDIQVLTPMQRGECGGSKSEPGAAGSHESIKDLSAERRHTVPAEG